VARNSYEINRCITTNLRARSQLPPDTTCTQQARKETNMSSVDVKCRRNCPRLPAILYLAVSSEDSHTPFPTQAFPIFISDLLFLFCDSLLAFPEPNGIKLFSFKQKEALYRGRGMWGEKVRGCHHGGKVRSGVLPQGGWEIVGENATWKGIGPFMIVKFSKVETHRETSKSPDQGLFEKSLISPRLRKIQTNYVSLCFRYTTSLYTSSHVSSEV